MKQKEFLDIKGQGSVEMILLIGSILIIVLIIASYLFNISTMINESFKITIESARNNILNKI